LEISGFFGVGEEEELLIRLAVVDASSIDVEIFGERLRSACNGFKGTYRGYLEKTIEERVLASPGTWGS